jgi:hypothetical protein
VSETWDSTPYERSDQAPDDAAATVVVEDVTSVEEIDVVEEAADTVVIEDDAVVAAQAEADLDRIDAIDDGSAAVGPGAAHEQQSSGTLAFALSAREQLAALPDPEVTGDARVDAATARLGDLAELPTSDHVAVYDDVHRRLQDALADAEVR